MPYATRELLSPRKVLGELQPGSVRSSTRGILPYLSKVEIGSFFSPLCPRVLPQFTILFYLSLPQKGHLV